MSATRIQRAAGHGGAEAGQGVGARADRAAAAPGEGAPAEEASAEDARAEAALDDRVRALLRTADRPLASAVRERARLVARAGFGADAEDAPALLEDGAVVGSYRIEGVIGAGGQAVVYRARHRQLPERVVAIKVPHGSAGRRMFAEARALAALRHPRVVALLDLDAEAPRPYLVIEHMGGGSLEDRLEAGGPLDERDALRIAFDVLDALGAAHAKGIVHRDLKPANVLFDDDGHASIADFGIGKIAADELSLSLTSGSATGLVGTPLYLAPEQERPGAPVDGRTDLYAFGKLLYHMLTGEAPRTIRPVDRSRAHLDYGWSDVIFRLTETDPARRYPDAASVARGLGAIADRRGSARLDGERRPAAHPATHAAAHPTALSPGAAARVIEAAAAARATLPDDRTYDEHPLAMLVAVVAFLVAGLGIFLEAKDAWIPLVLGLYVGCAAVGVVVTGWLDRSLKGIDLMGPVTAALSLALVLIGLEPHVVAEHHGATWALLGILLGAVPHALYVLGGVRTRAFRRLHQVTAWIAVLSLAASAAFQRPWVGALAAAHALAAWRLYRAPAEAWVEEA